MENSNKPTSWYAEMTPNPATMKFVANTLLVPESFTVEYKSIEETDNSPISKRIFSFPFVKGVFIASNFITVTKNDSINWEEVTIELKDFIRAEMLSGAFAYTGKIEDKKVEENIEEHEDDDEFEITRKINAVLEQFIRPVVENDGGAIHFKSYDDGIVTVILKGSCSGCPSASLTLKGGIERVLKQMIPSVTEVVAEEL